MTLVPQVRAIAADVDPTLRLSEWQRLDHVLEDVLWFIGLWMKITAVMTAVALLLSLSGIYSVMSFVVARRTREIGVRVALGASRGRVITAIFRRPLIQVGLGVVAGGALIALASTIETEMPGLSGDVSLGELAMVVAYAHLHARRLPPRLRRPDAPRTQCGADDRATNGVACVGWFATSYAARVRGTYHTGQCAW